MYTRTESALGDVNAEPGDTGDTNDQLIPPPEEPNAYMYPFNVHTRTVPPFAVTTGATTAFAVIV